jgi:hypothetical protein
MARTDFATAVAVIAIWIAVLLPAARALRAWLERRRWWARPRPYDQEVDR